MKKALTTTTSTSRTQIDPMRQRALWARELRYAEGERACRGDRMESKARTRLKRGLDGGSRVAYVVPCATST
jgi:hypothetical protein